MRPRAFFSSIAVLGGLVAACGADDTAPDPAAYAAEIDAWRAGRLERLKGPEGYLNLVGLYWLAEGPTRIGSAADNDIVFPAGAPSIGTLETSADGVLLVVAEGADVRHEGRRVASLRIDDDTTDDPVTATHGSLAWTVILRDGRFALRLRDYAHPAIAAFPPIEFFALDPALRVAARLRPYPEPRTVNVDTTIEGLGYHPQSPGTVVFEIEGVEQELEAYASGDELFFVFADRTSGRETYPAGRFLYAPAPDADGRTVLDFNRAYNPPCAFNAFATCPVASPRNRLRVRIEAGEKYDPAVHKLPGG